MYSRLKPISTVHSVPSTTASPNHRVRTASRHSATASENANAVCPDGNEFEPVSGASEYAAGGRCRATMIFAISELFQPTAITRNVATACTGLRRHRKNSAISTVITSPPTGEARFARSSIARFSQPVRSCWRCESHDSSVLRVSEVCAATSPSARAAANRASGIANQWRTFGIADTPTIGGCGPWAVRTKLVNAR